MFEGQKMTLKNECIVNTDMSPDTSKDFVSISSIFVLIKQEQKV